jgi:hypothetical protein
VLNIHHSNISPDGLFDISRLLDSTQLRTICFVWNHGVFKNLDATQHFVTTLQLKKSSVQAMPGIYAGLFPAYIRTQTFISINNSLTRNQQLNCVNLLLAPPPPPQQQQQQQNIDRNTALMMLKTWHKAIAKFAKVPNTHFQTLSNTSTTAGKAPQATHCCYGCCCCCYFATANIYT